MGMVVRTNTMALNAYRQLGMNNSAVAKSLEKLSSGFKINRAGDDAAGLAISEKMKAQIKGLETASSNAQDGISLIQTAEGNLNEVHSMLNRMVELATKSANGTFQNEVDREAIQAEVDSLLEEIDRISQSANFNGIKLLNGDLAERVTTGRFAEVERGTVSTVAGIDKMQGSNGAGAKGVYEIDLTGSLFGEGDSIKINGTTNGSAAFATITLAYGTQIKGDTAEEQAQSIADAISANGTMAPIVDVKVEGSKVIISAKKEGTDQPTIDSIDITDASVKLGTPTLTASTTANAGTQGGWDSVIGAGANGQATGYNVEAGDVIEFNFKDSSGVTMTAKVTVTDSMVANNPTIADLTEKIVDALKKAKFEDNTDTVADESLVTVGDLFTINANKTYGGTSANGGIQAFANTLGNGTLAVDKVVIKNAQGKQKGSDIAASNAGTGTAATTAAKAEIAASTGNFSKDDTFTIKGKLSDGRDFTATLVAGKDFTIGANYTASVSAIINALSSGSGLDGKIEVDIEGQKVDSSKVFGTGTGAEFTMANAGGALTVQSTKMGVGKGVSGTISTIEAKAVSSSEGVSLTVAQAPEDPGHAASTISFDNKAISYGAAVKIGDQVFELVADSRDVTSRNNVAVVVEDLKNASSSDIAKAFMDAAKDEDLFVDKAEVVDASKKFDDTPETGKVAVAMAKGQKYAVSVDGGKLTIETLDKGSSVEAPKIDTVYGDKVEQLAVKFDSAKTKYGDSFNFNGNTYEFVAKAEDAKEGNIAMVVPDMAKATAKSLGQAFVDVVKNGTATLENDGTVIVKSQVDPNGVRGELSFTFEGRGLTLQIGDTSDDFNKVSVYVENMSSKGLGVNGLNVLTQDSAGDAIDVIRNAINKVSTARANMGALQNRLEYTINNLDVAAENMSAANSRIRDTDMAKEMMNYTKMNVLVQSAQAMLAQANQQPQSVLQLLQ